MISPLQGVRILITGGTGSFGQAFARHAIQSGADTVCIYSRGELAQANMRQAMDPVIESRLRWFIGDVRDRARLQEAIQGVDIVIHAAALKRVEVGEYNPLEMTRTNVDGAINVIHAAHHEQRWRYGHGRPHGRLRVVALSTDKACAPINAYGASKLMAEKLFLAAGAYGQARFAVTRYGNVAGSQGSVIPTWRAALKANQPIRITTPQATRFWMGLQQAVDLVEFTVSEMREGEIFVPRLPAYEVMDLATAIRGNATTPHMITGLGAGEKLHECMISQDEAPEFVALKRRPVCVRPGPDRAWIAEACKAVESAGLNSYHADRLTVADLANRLKGIP